MGVTNALAALSLLQQDALQRERRTSVCESLCLALSASSSDEAPPLRLRFFLSLSLSLLERLAFLLRLLSLPVLLRFLCLLLSLRDERLRCRAHGMQVAVGRLYETQ